MTFEGSGTFKDRTAFRRALDERLEALKSRLPGAPREIRVVDHGEERVNWDYMGARLEVTVRDHDWSYEVELPPYLPIAPGDVQSMVEGEFSDLADF